MEKVTGKAIVSWLQEQVEKKAVIPPKLWLDIAFKLNVLKLPETETLELMRQNVARRKLEVLKTQEKRNVAAADLELEATDESREMKNQEHLIEQIDEFIMIAKKNSENL